MLNLCCGSGALDRGAFRSIGFAFDHSPAAAAEFCFSKGKSPSSSSSFWATAAPAGACRTADEVYALLARRELSLTAGNSGTHLSEQNKQTSADCRTTCEANRWRIVALSGQKEASCPQLQDGGLLYARVRNMILIFLLNQAADTAWHYQQPGFQAVCSTGIEHKQYLACFTTYSREFAPLSAGLRQESHWSSRAILSRSSKILAVPLIMVRVTILTSQRCCMDIASPFEPQNSFITEDNAFEQQPCDHYSTKSLDSTSFLMLLWSQPPYAYEPSP